MELLDTQAAAAYLTRLVGPISPLTLRAKRTAPGGPRFVRQGRRIYYLREHLEAWAAEQLTVHATTADAGEKFSPG